MATLNAVPIPDLTIMSNENLVKGTTFLRDITNVHITSRRTVYTKRMDVQAIKGDDILNRPMFTNSAQYFIDVDRVSIPLNEISKITAIDRQQIEEGEEERMQYEEEAVVASTQHVVERYFNLFNTLITTAGNYVAGREQAAAATWSTTATATPYVDLKNLMNKLLLTSGIRRQDEGWRLLLSQNLADLVEETDDYKERMNRVNVVETGNQIIDLSAYFKMKVHILSHTYYGKDGTSYGSRIFGDNIATVVWKDWNNTNVTGIIDSRNIALDNSTFLWVLKDLRGGFDDLRQIDMEMLSVPIDDALYRFSKPVIKAYSYMSDDGISQKNIKAVTDGDVYLNLNNRLGRITGTV